MGKSSCTNSTVTILPAKGPAGHHQRSWLRRLTPPCWMAVLFMTSGLIWYESYRYYYMYYTGGSQRSGNKRSVTPHIPNDRIYSSAPLTPRPTNVFFVESSCSFTNESPEPGGLRMNNRQACAVYSTAALNPNRHVYIFHTCPLHTDYYNQSDEGVKRMLELGNVAVIDGWRGSEDDWLLAGSPLMSLAPKLKTSSFRVEHASDASRLLLLWKFGGTYLDLDFISVRSLEDLGVDWTCAEDSGTVANGALNSGPTGPGHVMFGRFLEAFVANFDGAQWSANGPILLTSVIHSVCNLSQEANMQEVGRMNDCGFTVYPSQVFYPIEYPSWRSYFDEGAWPKVNSTLGSSVHAVHFWNKLSKDEVVTVGSSQPYGLLAAQYCSPVYYASGPSF